MRDWCAAVGLVVDIWLTRRALRAATDAEDRRQLFVELVELRSALYRRVWR